MLNNLFESVIGSKVSWDDKEWTVEDIELCNLYGVNLTFKEGGRVNYHLIRISDDGETVSARINASKCY